MVRDLTAKLAEELGESVSILEHHDFITVKAGGREVDFKREPIDVLPLDLTVPSVASYFDDSRKQFSPSLLLVAKRSSRVVFDAEDIPDYWSHYARYYKFKILDGDVAYSCTDRLIEDELEVASSIYNEDISYEHGKLKAFGREWEVVAGDLILCIENHGGFYEYTKSLMELGPYEMEPGETVRQFFDRVEESLKRRDDAEHVKLRAYESELENAKKVKQALENPMDNNDLATHVMRGLHQGAVDEASDSLIKLSKKALMEADEYFSGGENAETIEDFLDSRVGREFCKGTGAATLSWLAEKWGHKLPISKEKIQYWAGLEVQNVTRDSVQPVMSAVTDEVFDLMENVGEIDMPEEIDKEAVFKEEV